MNFQMNRWFSWVGETGMLEEMRSAAPRIATYADWKREFLALAENASQQGHVLRAGYYYRAAEFFMRVNDADRKAAREHFLHAVRSVSVWRRLIATQYLTPMGTSKDSCPRTVSRLPNRKARLFSLAGSIVTLRS